MTSEGKVSQDSHARSGPQPRAWWKEASVYQIYPASFCDTTGNGTGDIPGIISKMDYIKALGVDVVWLCPVFASPQIDMGYDISDYKTIDPQYGTIEDVDTLMNGLHERGVKLLLDLVVNHTSDQHEWFKQSKSGKDSPYRDWYIWRKPKYDNEGNRQPPNNWVSHFEGESLLKLLSCYIHYFIADLLTDCRERMGVRRSIRRVLPPLICHRAARSELGA